MGMSGRFRLSIWDPWLTVCQIITIQGMWYSSLGLILYMTNWVTGDVTTLHQLFSYSGPENSLGKGVGTLVILVYLFNSLMGSVYLWYVMERTKACLDFACTIHALHLLVTWIHNGYFPTGFTWLLLNGICVAITCIMAEFMCMKSEMKSIPLLTKSDL